MSQSWHGCLCFTVCADGIVTRERNRGPTLKHTCSDMPQYVFFEVVIDKQLMTLFRIKCLQVNKSTPTKSSTKNVPKACFVY